MTGLAEALRTVPRVDAVGWSTLPGWTRFAVAARVSVLPMTLFSATIGGLLALRQPDFHSGLWIASALGLMAAHATNNLINDLVDYSRGLDRGDYHRARYGTQVLGAGLVTRAQMLGYIAIAATVAIAAAVWAIAVRGTGAAVLAGAGAFFVLFYTWPLKPLGLGEPAVLLVWGPLMCGGACFVACGEWRWEAAGLGTVYALGPTCVLFGKHIDKLPADAARGIRTLPVLLGEARARHWVVAMIALAVALPGMLALLGFATPWLLLTLLAALPARRTIAMFLRPPPVERPAAFPEEVWPLWYAHHAFALTLRTGFLLLIGLGLGAITA